VGLCGTSLHHCADFGTGAGGRCARNRIVVGFLGLVEEGKGIIWECRMDG